MTVKHGMPATGTTYSALCYNSCHIAGQSITLLAHQEALL